MFNSAAPDKSRQGNLGSDDEEVVQEMAAPKVTAVTDEAKSDGEVPYDSYDLTEEDEKMVAAMEEKMRNRRVVNSNKTKESVMFKFSVYVLGITRLDSSTQSYRCRFEVSCYQQMTKKQKMDYIKDPDNWKPDHLMQVYPLNTVELLEREMMTFHHGGQFVVYYDEDFKSLSINNIWWLNAEISEELELQNFPFDVQHLEIPITFEFRDQNYMRNYRHVMMAEYCMFMILDGVANLNGFNIDTPHLEFKCIGYDNFPPKYAFLRFTVQREWKFYVARVMSALAMISFLTNLAFIFGDIDDTLSDRFGYIASMFLSAVAYLYIITTYLPILKYFTFLDKYMFGTFMYIFIIAVECWFVKENSHRWNVDLDFILLVGNYVLWLLVHVWFVWSARKALTFEQKKFNMIKEEVDDDPSNKNKHEVTGPMCVFGKEKGHDQKRDYNGATIYTKNNFNLEYDDLPHVRYGWS
eukprot:CAMPEP_0197074020 /NCGR_PEP_ID=MMETSP1384-20130603/210898_1 /TAXON_ID=29189 /ORGANISM="Ammonia sp." /LENGTH=465 /DNA_ID=CAMNT_0042512861 /DNA_START=22 /DNA_END=1419 /DNA_ORIENTATION=-